MFGVDAQNWWDSFNTCTFLIGSMYCFILNDCFVTGYIVTNNCCTRVSLPILELVGVKYSNLTDQ